MPNLTIPQMTFLRSPAESLSLSIPDPDFRWKTRNHEFLAPSQMVTQHVFYTLRMIWNHRMPEDALIEPFQRYHLAGYYTDKYLGKAIRNLALELATRSDIEPQWRTQLEHMINYLRGSPGKLPAAVLEGIGHV